MKKKIRALVKFSDKIHKNVPELDVVSLFGLILAFSHSKVKISFAPGGFRLDILT